MRIVHIMRKTMKFVPDGPGGADIFPKEPEPESQTSPNLPR